MQIRFRAVDTLAPNIREPLKRRLVRKVTDEPRPLLHIDYVSYRALAREAFGDAFADALRPAVTTTTFPLNSISAF